MRREQPAARPATYEPWVLVRDVVAERYRRDPRREDDDEAAMVAAGLTGVRWDWAGRPCVTWSHAAELLESMQAETRRILADRAERQARSDASWTPSGVVGVTRPGQPDWVSPTLAKNPMPAFPADA